MRSVDKLQSSLMTTIHAVGSAFVENGKAFCLDGWGKEEWEGECSRFGLWIEYSLCFVSKYKMDSKSCMIIISFRVHLNKKEAGRLIIIMDDITAPNRPCG